MIYLVNCNRKELAKIVAGKATLSKNDVQEIAELRAFDLDREELLLGWRDSPSERFSIPNFIIVHEDSLSDLLAWIATYFRDIQPFSSQCRILTREKFKFAVEGVQESRPTPIGAVDIALIIAESAAYSVGSIELSRLPFSAFERSLSFAFSRAIRQFNALEVVGSMGLELLEQSWMRARELAGEPALELNSRSIREVWDIVLRSNSQARSNRNNKDNDIVNWIRGFRKDGDLPIQILHWLPANLDFARATLFELDEKSRESRVIAFEDTVQALLRHEQLPMREKCFLLGYVASRISPGTLNHISVLFPLIEHFRESLLWFAVFAGLAPESSVADFANGLGWLLNRELGRASSVLDRPTCDISLDEFTMLATNGPRARKYSVRTTSSGILKIEIYPLVTTNVRWPQGNQEAGESRAFTQSRNTLQIDEKRDNELIRMMARLEEHAMTMEQLKVDLARLMNRRK